MVMRNEQWSSTRPRGGQHAAQLGTSPVSSPEIRSTCSTSHPQWGSLRKILRWRCAQQQATSRQVGRCDVWCDLTRDDQGKARQTAWGPPTCIMLGVWGFPCWGSG